ncbi:hypothetical protein BH23GEM9_BH23GEM9_26220 [soil metagenome]
MNITRSVAGRGAVAGIAGGTALVLWFLIGDIRQGDPFRTPAFLASVIGFGDVQATALSIALYTLLHFALLILVGIAAAWAAEQIGSGPVLLLGIVLGFLLFDLAFYGSVWITGISVADELGWGRVLLGNIIAGLTIFIALAVMGAINPVNWRQVMAEHYTIREGLLAGLIGATAVAVWFLIVDLISGQVLLTPAALGSAVFLGARGVATVEITALTVLGYTAIHYVAFILVGLLAAAIVAAAEEHEEAILLGGVLLFVTFEALSIGLLTIVASWLVDALAWWNIAIANLIAAVAMGGFLYLRHPDLMRGVRDRNLEEDLANDVTEQRAPGPRVPEPRPAPHGSEPRASGPVQR